MPPIIEGPPRRDEPLRPWPVRLLWFVGLGAGGAAAVAAFAYLLRALIF